MPIKQDRMIAVIEAAQAFRRSRETLTANIHHWAELAFSGQLSSEDALQHIMEAARLTPEGEHYATIGAEEAHFKRVAAKNIRDQTRRLAQRGLIPDPHITRGTIAQTQAHMQEQRARLGLAPSMASPSPSTPSQGTPSQGTPAPLGKVEFDMGESAAFADNTGEFFDVLGNPTSRAQPPVPTQADLAEDARLAEEAMRELAALRDRGAMDASANQSPNQPVSGWKPISQPAGNTTPQTKENLP